MFRGIAKRDLASALLKKTRTLPWVLRARRTLSAPYLTILTYHRVADMDPGAWFDPNIVDATCKQFDQQMSWIAEHFSVIDTGALSDYLVGCASLPKNPCLITFDDGYLDALSNALPILKRHNLKAVFFIATDFVEKRRVYWWDRLHYLVMRSQQATVSLTYPEALTLDLSQPAKAHRLCLRIVKDTYDLDVEKFLNHVGDALKVNWTEALEGRLADETVMTWDDIRTMRDAGMDIQSHSVSHRVLDTLSADELNGELAQSKAMLEAKLQQPIRAIAYPVGRSVRRHPHIVEAVRRAGYELGFSNLSGVEKLSRSLHRFDISRLAMDRVLTQARFEMMTALPGM